MKNLFKLKAAIGSAAVLLLSAGSAFASFGVTLGNTGTGSSSSNTSTASVSDTGVFSLTNSRTQSNSLGVSASTGGNAFGSNTDIGNIMTGGIHGTAAVMTTPVINPVIDLSGLGAGNGSVDLSNDTTGASSSNSSTATVVHTNVVGISNSNTVSNTVSAAVSSGGNAVSNNTVVGSFHGGDASYNVAVSNPGSGSLGLSGIIMPATPSTTTVSGENHLTGSGSVNTNSTSLTSTDSVGISNTSNVTNSVGVTASSGGNSVGNNTSVGDVSTGNSDVNVMITN